MVAPGTALREGLDNILHAHTGGLLVIGDHDELSFLFSGGHQARRRLHAGAALPGGQDGRRHRPQRQRDQDRDGQRPADAGPDGPDAGDRHAPPHRRARLQADRRDRHRHLPAPRGRLALRRRREVHPRGHPRRPGQGQPGAGDARQVPHAPRPGLHAPHRAGVRGRRDAARRPDGPPALRARDAHGRRDRALHRRARHRGPPHRDAARGGHGRRRRRQGRAHPRLPGGGLRRDVRRRARPARAACPIRTCSTSAASPS